MLSGIEQFLKLDLSKWLKVLRDLELLPKVMNQDWSWIWLQKFDGHVTILVSVDRTCAKRRETDILLPPPPSIVQQDVLMDDSSRSLSPVIVNHLFSQSPVLQIGSNS